MDIDTKENDISKNRNTFYRQAFKPDGAKMTAAESHKQLEKIQDLYNVHIGSKRELVLETEDEDSSNQEVAPTQPSNPTATFSYFPGTKFWSVCILYGAP